jgi:hypothetical protein
VYVTLSWSPLSTATSPLPNRAVAQSLADEEASWSPFVDGRRTATGEEHTLHGARAGDVEDRDRAIRDRLARSRVFVPDRTSYRAVGVAGVRVGRELVPAVAGLIDVVVDVSRQPEP